MGNSARLKYMLYLMMGAAGAAVIVFLVSANKASGPEVEEYANEDAWATSPVLSGFTDDCAKFVFDYPKDWELIEGDDGKNSAGTRASWTVTNHEGVTLKLFIGHTGDTEGEYLGTKCTITEECPAVLAAPDSAKFGKGYGYIVANEIITGIMEDYLHDNSYNTYEERNAIEMLAVVPGSWVGDWSDPSRGGSYLLRHTAGAPYVSVFPESEDVKDNAGHHEIGNLVTLAFYCSDSGSLSDNDRAKAIATLSSLRSV